MPVLAVVLPPIVRGRRRGLLYKRLKKRLINVVDIVDIRRSSSLK